MSSQTESLPTTTLVVGSQSESIDLSEASLVAVRRVETAAGVRLLEVQKTGAGAHQATIDSLANLVDWPDLAASFMEDDQIGVAVGEGIAEVAEVAAGLIESLGTAGIEMDQITLVAALKQDFEKLLAELSDQLQTGLKVVQHDPTDDKELCFAGVDSKDRSLMLNRRLFEADVVLPLLAARPRGSSGPETSTGGPETSAGHDCRGVYTDFYPAFSDSESIKRFSQTELHEGQNAAQQLRNETDHAGWVFGIPLSVFVTPGAAGQVAAVVAGETAKAGELAAETCRGLWGRRASQRVSLVVATLSNEPARQTWNDVARALAAAEDLVEPHGAVALCTGLSQPINRSLRQLAEADDLEGVVQRLDRDPSPDAWATRQIANALLRGPVYLLSELEEDDVESISLAPLGNAKELQRLASRHESCAILEDADRVFVEVSS